MCGRGRRDPVREEQGDARALFERGRPDRHCSRTVGFELGAIVRSTNGRLIVAPPLVIDHAQIDELVDTMRKAVDATAREVLGIDC